MAEPEFSYWYCTALDFPNSPNNPHIVPCSGRIEPGRVLTSDRGAIWTRPRRGLSGSCINVQTVRMLSEEEEPIWRLNGQGWPTHYVVEAVRPATLQEGDAVFT